MQLNRDTNKENHPVANGAPCPVDPLHLHRGKNWRHPTAQPATSNPNTAGEPPSRHPALVKKVRPGFKARAAATGTGHRRFGPRGLDRVLHILASTGGVVASQATGRSTVLLIVGEGGLCMIIGPAPARVWSRMNQLPTPSNKFTEAGRFTLPLALPGPRNGCSGWAVAGC